MAHEDRIKSLEKRMEKVEKVQSMDSQKIDQMYRGLFGDEQIHYEGLIESNKRHNKFIDNAMPVIEDFKQKIERRKNRGIKIRALIKWLVIVGSGITAWVLDLIKKIPWMK